MGLRLQWRCGAEILAFDWVVLDWVEVRGTCRCWIGERTRCKTKVDVWVGWS